MDISNISIHQSNLQGILSKVLNGPTAKRQNMHACVHLEDLFEEFIFGWMNKLYYVRVKHITIFLKETCGEETQDVVFFHLMLIAFSCSLYWVKHFPCTNS